MAGMRILSSSIRIALLCACVGCSPSADRSSDSDSSVDHDALVGPDGETDGGDPGPSGFIGSPCGSLSDCDYEGGVCVTEGFPNGICTLPCDELCPDEDGHPVTFCAEAADLPPAAAVLGDGACLARCNFLFFEETGCRPGYGCVVVNRPGDPEARQYVCLPDRQSELGECYLALASRSVGFEPIIYPDTHPSTHPDLTCHIEDPLELLSPVHGVELQSSGGTVTPRVLAACSMAHALVSTVDDVALYGVDALLHMGTFNCRVISGTDTLSRHGFGDAIDIAGFHFTDGTLYTVYDHWEHDTTDPRTEGGVFLYQAAQRWYDDYIWNIILTPNYNADHDNHFHVDLTPSSHFIGFTDGRYFGPAPYPD